MEGVGLNADLISKVRRHREARQDVGESLAAAGLWVMREAVKARGSVDGAGDQPPDPTNRGASNSNPVVSGGLNSVGSVTGGVDYLVCNLWCVCSEWPEVRALLEAGKQSAQEDDSGEVGGIIKLPSGHIVKVRRSGFRAMTMLAYVIEMDGWTIAFSDGPKGPDKMLMCHLSVPGQPCLYRGIASILAEFEEILMGLGVSVLRESIQRADLCADVVGLSMRQVVLDWLQGKCIKRGENWSLRGRDDLNGSETLTVGDRDRVQCQFYDKVQETKNDEKRRQFMIAKRWGGELPDEATRVEFSIAGQVLKELGIRNRSDLVKLPEVVGYLVTKWIRFAENAVDRTNTTRAATARWWKTVAGLFEAWAGRWMEPAKREPVEPERATNLGKQAAGVIAAAFVKEGYKATRPQIVATFVRSWFERHGSFLRQRVVEKATLAAVAGDQRHQWALRQSVEAWQAESVMIEPGAPVLWGLSGVV